jgi:hypothetical protein
LITLTITHFDRLNAIDIGWARWSITLHMSIYAAIPLGSNEPSFNIIKPLRLGALLIQISSNKVFKEEGLPVPKIIQNNLQKKGIHTDDAYENLIESFISLSILESNLKWLIFANDHTFMIPNNLDLFLSNLDSNYPVYSGNKLQRGKRYGFLLYFASGVHI